MNPEVAVLMTVYNGMPYLEASVESVLNQTLQNFTFIIVDDGSKDETVAYLDNLTDPRVKVIRQKNQGTAAAANHGLEYIDTDFVARMDADDIAMPDRLEKQLKFMKSHPKVGLSGAQVAPIGDKSVGKSLKLPQTHEGIFGAMMMGRHGLAHSSIIIRTSVLKELGGYWKLPLIDDWDMMLRMGEVSELANLPDVLLNYRVHSGSLNGQSMLRMHRHISYAIERAKRRQSDRPQISFEEFLEQQEQRPALEKISEKVHVYALAQYRMAVAEIHGGKKIKGTGRLAWSALCSPSRTYFRIKRILTGDKGSAPASISKEVPEANVSPVANSQDIVAEPHEVNAS